MAIVGVVKYQGFRQELDNKLIIADYEGHIMYADDDKNLQTLHEFSNYVHSLNATTIGDLLFTTYDDNQKVSKLYKY